MELALLSLYIQAIGRESLEHQPDVLGMFVHGAGKHKNVIKVHKHKAAPTGEEEGRIMPAASDWEMYFSIDSLSGLDRLYRRLVGRGAPGRRSMGQS